MIRRFEQKIQVQAWQVTQEWLANMLASKGWSECPKEVIEAATYGPGHIIIRPEGVVVLARGNRIVLSAGMWLVLDRLDIVVYEHEEFVEEFNEIP